MTNPKVIQMPATLPELASNSELEAKERSFCKSLEEQAFAVSDARANLNAANKAMERVAASSRRLLEEVADLRRCYNARMVRAEQCYSGEQKSGRVVL